METVTSAGETAVSESVTSVTEVVEKSSEAVTEKVNEASEAAETKAEEAKEAVAEKIEEVSRPGFSTNILDTPRNGVVGHSVYHFVGPSVHQS